MNQRWWLLLERAQAALPLLAAAGLAGFTWWLVQSSPKEGSAARPALAASVPDFELNQARVARFDAQGRIEAVLDGQTMRHYPDTDRLQIDQLTLSARDDKGLGLRAVSQRGEADRKAEVVTLSGGAKVTALPATDPGTGLRAAPAHFTGEGLRIDTRTRVVSSDQPVLLQQQGSEVRAQNMRYDDRTGITDLGGRVRGQYEVPAR
ncbi:hypothetical protein JY96_11035 [Aquabacterium sp. NJ1]|uniref:LPS export ABC transporter periplasmic protein LptC n=1 Tax=Aquabacterium sp. NJ1 TaxID=1538295 RepID=UPI00052C6E66|nr:LPS export ABC transporter periplasmic protein LptC [Aquabacterium sp. NJ1]KGM40383.1 hypothetical protein JY96_11035 [Aquabacterium sp. NJ1]